MDQKSIAWVSYLTIIGWIVALVSYNSSPDKSSLARFHLRQVFGIFATGFALWIGTFMLIFVMPFFVIIFPVIYIALLFFGSSVLLPQLMAKKNLYPYWAIFTRRHSHLSVKRLLQREQNNKLSSVST